MEECSSRSVVNRSLLFHLDRSLLVATPHCVLKFESERFCPCTVRPCCRAPHCPYLYLTAVVPPRVSHYCPTLAGFALRSTPLLLSVREHSCGVPPRAILSEVQFSKDLYRFLHGRECDSFSTIFWQGAYEHLLEITHRCNGLEKTIDTLNSRNCDGCCKNSVLQRVPR